MGRIHLAQPTPKQVTVRNDLTNLAERRMSQKIVPITTSQQIDQSLPLLSLFLLLVQLLQPFFAKWEGLDSVAINELNSITQSNIITFVNLITRLQNNQARDALHLERSTQGSSSLKI
uniref:Uncharacterized protein n=1 Tax=Opuntia streptacantha TaxID=393608 RepID=A0A7C9E8A1_OPUST